MFPDVQNKDSVAVLFVNWLSFTVPENAVSSSSADYIFATAMLNIMQSLLCFRHFYHK